MTKVIKISLGKGGEIEVDLDKLQGEAVKDYIFMYGLKQMLNDVHASEKDAAAKKGLSQKKLDSLYRGEVAQARGFTGDPVAREMKAMAQADLTAKIKAAGKKLKDFSEENLKAALAKLLEKNEASYRKAAEAKLAIKVEKIDSADIMDLLED